MSGSPAASRGFGSDNHAGAHPEVIAAIAAANAGHADAYGADPWTRRLEDAFRHLLGREARAFPVFNGTGANLLCLDVLADPHEGVICTAEAHINVDECGAPERLAGLKLLTVEGEHGKLRPEDLGRWESRRDDEHAVQPRVVSISQATEAGTVYTPEEVRAIAEAAHALGMCLHVDGARIANAAASLDVSPAALTSEAGVDAISFGGTKNGLMFGEVAVFLGELDPAREARIRFARKQLTQLASKMRFVSAQFEALLEDDLWLRSARRSNAMAALLAERLAAIDGVEVVHPVEANGVFARLPEGAVEAARAALPGAHPLHVWDEPEGIVRLMCAWDTSPEDIDRLVDAIG